MSSKFPRFGQRDGTPAPYRGVDETVNILVVEDNPGDVRLLQEAFESVDATPSIDVANDGDEALEFLQAGTDGGGVSQPPVDLVLLDLNLSRTDGFEVLEAIRSDPMLSSLPVLVLSSSDAREDIRRCYDLAANAYLSKPDDIDGYEQLVEVLAAFWFETARIPTADRR